MCSRACGLQLLEQHISTGCTLEHWGCVLVDFVLFAVCVQAGWGASVRNLLWR